MDKRANEAFEVKLTEELLVLAGLCGLNVWLPYTVASSHDCKCIACFVD